MVVFQFIHLVNIFEFILYFVALCPEYNYKCYYLKDYSMLSMVYEYISFGARYVCESLTFYSIVYTLVTHITDCPFNDLIKNRFLLLCGIFQ